MAAASGRERELRRRRASILLEVPFSPGVFGREVTMRRDLRTIRPIPLAVLVTVAGIGAAGAQSEIATETDPPLVHEATSPVHIDFGFGTGRFLASDDERASNSSGLQFGVAFPLSRTLQLTLSTKGLDFGRATDASYRSAANAELGARWSPFGRIRSRELALRWSHLQLEAGIGLARASLGSWGSVNPFDQDERRFGLGFSTGARWLPYVTDGLAGGFGAWYVGQALAGGRRDAWIFGFALELGN
jgi:hypothetical protein